MTDFEKCKRAYMLGATEEQLMVWVKAGRLTQDEFNEIVGGANDGH